MNIGTSKRSACDAIGHTEYQSVRNGNVLLERTDFNQKCILFHISKSPLYLNKPKKLKYVSKFGDTIIRYNKNSHFLLDLVRNMDRRTSLLVLLVTALGGVWTVEQPSGSLLEFYLPNFMGQGS